MGSKLSSELLGALPSAFGLSVLLIVLGREERSELRLDGEDGRGRVGGARLIESDYWFGYQVGKEVQQTDANPQ